MKSLTDFKDPFDAILEFESLLADYTGAPYCVTTDCCTHALEIAFRLTHNGSTVLFPSKTYLSVLMMMHKVGIKYQLKDVNWRDFYIFENTNIWDCARYFEKNMYQSGSIQCISFGRTKPLEIGRGGCLLTDNFELYKQASKMRSDGRDLFNRLPWAEQEIFDVGYHYTLKPEDCIVGLNLLEQQKFTIQLDKYFEYPDCRKITINERQPIF